MIHVKIHFGCIALLSLIIITNGLSMPEDWPGGFHSEKQAIAGQLFSAKIDYGAELSCNVSRIQVSEAYSHDQPLWIVLNATSGSLYGVPQECDVGAIVLFVTAIGSHAEGQEFICSKLVWKVTVELEPMSLAHALSQYIENTTILSPKIEPFVKCSAHPTVMVATLNVAFKAELSADYTVNFANLLAASLGIPHYAIQLVDSSSGITFYKQLKSIKIIQYGNLQTPKSNESQIIVSWPLGCDQNDVSLFDIHDIRRRSLPKSNELTLNSWHLTSGHLDGGLNVRKRRGIFFGSITALDGTPAETSGIPTKILSSAIFTSIHPLVNTTISSVSVSTNRPLPTVFSNVSSAMLQTNVGTFLSASLKTSQGGASSTVVSQVTSATFISSVAPSLSSYHTISRSGSSYHAASLSFTLPYSTASPKNASSIEPSRSLQSSCLKGACAVATSSTELSRGSLLSATGEVSSIALGFGSSLARNASRVLLTSFLQPSPTTRAIRNTTSQAVFPTTSQKHLSSAFSSAISSVSTKFTHGKSLPSTVPSFAISASVSPIFSRYSSQYSVESSFYQRKSRIASKISSPIFKADSSTVSSLRSVMSSFASSHISMISSWLTSNSSAASQVSLLTRKISQTRSSLKITSFFVASPLNSITSSYIATRISSFRSSTQRSSIITDVVGSSFSPSIVTRSTFSTSSASVLSSFETSKAFTSLQSFTRRSTSENYTSLTLPKTLSSRMNVETSRLFSNPTGPSKTLITKATVSSLSVDSSSTSSLTDGASFKSATSPTTTGITPFFSRSLLPSTSSVAVFSFSSPALSISSRLPTYSRSYSSGFRTSSFQLALSHSATLPRSYSSVGTSALATSSSRFKSDASYMSSRISSIQDTIFPPASLSLSIMKSSRSYKLPSTILTTWGSASSRIFQPTIASSQIATIDASRHLTASLRSPPQSALKSSSLSSDKKTSSSLSLISTPRSITLTAISDLIKPSLNSAKPSATIAPSVSISGSVREASQTIMTTSQLLRSDHRSTSSYILFSSGTKPMSTSQLTVRSIITSLGTTLSSLLKPNISLSTTATLRSILTTAVTLPPNTNPIVVNSIGRVTAYVGRLFVYRIPFDTFYDKESGYTPNLIVTCRYASGLPLQRSFWIVYDNTTQTLSGLPFLEEYSNQGKGGVSIEVVAMDKFGAAARDVFNVYIENLPVDVQFTLTAQISRSFQEFQADSSLKIALFYRIVRFYNTTANSNYYASSLTNGSVIYSWSDTTISGTVCNTSAIAKLLRYIQLPSGSLTPQFAQAMLPDFPVLGVSRSYYGVCLPLPITPLIPVKPAAGEGTEHIFLRYVVPTIAVALVLALIFASIILLSKRRRSKPPFLEKNTFRKGQPVLLPEEYELDKFKRPAVELPEDHIFGDGGYEDGSSVHGFDDEEDGTHFMDNPIYGLGTFTRPPPAYHQKPDTDDNGGTYESPYSRPPPTYQLPPMYADQDFMTSEV